MLNRVEFHNVFSSYYQELCRFANIIVGCKMSADEIVQNVFVSLWENRNSCQVKKDTKAYLYKSVKNSAFSFLKSNDTRKNYELEFINRKELDKGSGIDQQLFRTKLKEAIERLPERCRLVYCLKYIEGLNYKEIADYLDISTNTVDNHIQKALKKLKEELGKIKTELYNN